MARNVKCCICKKEIKKDDAYMFTYTSQSGKEYRKYCCSLEEKENMEREKELYREIQYLTDEILGRPITNNTRNKELKELHESYSWEQILRCIRAKSDDIKKLIEYNDIQSDYQQIRYMMQVIKNSIYDFSKEDERANQWEQYVSETSEEEFIEEEEDIASRLKNKKENKNNIASFLDSLK